MTEWDDSVWQSNSNITLKHLWKRIMTFVNHLESGSVLALQSSHLKGMYSGCPCLIQDLYPELLYPTLSSVSWPISWSHFLFLGL